MIHRQTVLATGGAATEGGAATVTLDKSLKRRGRLSRARSVLSRDERIAKMREEERWTEGRSPFNLPKIRVPKLSTGKKKKAAKETAEEGDAKTEAPKK